MAIIRHKKIMNKKMYIHKVYPIFVKIQYAIDKILEKSIIPTLTVEKKQKRCKACKYRADSVFKVYM